MSPGFALFDTAIGRCGIAWSERGIVAVQLPEATGAKTRARLQKRAPDALEGAAPPAVRLAIERIVAHLRGEAADIAAIELDLEGVGEFERRVYEIARNIPPGSSLTYGEIASRIGEPGAARAVGQALAHNPFPLVVPCHRVLGAHGKTGGFSANGGVSTKMRLLTIEGGPKSEEPLLFGRLPAVARPRAQS
jgi:methylated-DNA-[protein]-cysteine S-methyltransferase